MSTRFKCWILCLLLMTAFSPEVWAAQTEPDEIDVIFAIDAGLYKEGTNSQKIMDESFRLWMDLNRNRKMKIGYVLFTDSVLAQRRPAYVEQDQKREEILTQLHLPEFQETAEIKVSIGLQKARELLDGSPRPVIVLFSASAPSGDEQLNTALDQLKKEKVRVYTIGVDTGGTDSLTELSRIAGMTGGISFELPSQDMLLEIPGRILADMNQTKLRSLGCFTGDGESLAINMSIPDSSAEAVNLILFSGAGITDFEVYGQDGRRYNPDFVRIGEQYTLIRLNNPQKGSWKLFVKGEAGDRIIVNMLSEYVLSLEYDQDPEKEYKKGIQESFSARLWKFSGCVEDQSLYENAYAGFRVKNLQTGMISENKAQIRNQTVYGTYVFERAGQYELQFYITGARELFYLETESKKVTVLPQKIRYSDPSPKPVVWLLSDLWNDQKKLPLKRFIQWDEDCEIKIRIEKTDGKEDICSWEYDQEEQTMILRAEKPGQIRLRLSAGYEAEETLTYTLSVRVLPVWAPFAVFAGMLLLICALIRICRGKIKKR